MGAIDKVMRMMRVLFFLEDVTKYIPLINKLTWRLSYNYWRKHYSVYDKPEKQRELLEKWTQ